MINYIGHIKKEFPFNIEENLEDDEWVSEQNRLIEGQIIEWQESKRMFEAKVEGLILVIEKPKFH